MDEITEEISDEDINKLILDLSVVHPFDIHRGIIRKLIAHHAKTKDIQEQCAQLVWSELMNYCKDRFKDPSFHNELFAICEKIRALARYNSIYK
jgi:hypothetical protein